jgi:hypothetical protein
MMVAAGLILIPEVLREEAPIAAFTLTSCSLGLLQEHEVGEFIPGYMCTSARAEFSKPS